MAPEPTSGDPGETPTGAAEAGAPEGVPAEDVAGGTGDRRGERYGEVELSRHRKGDGRTLILYRWHPDGELRP
jgi:hypothetical protein